MEKYFIFCMFIFLSCIGEARVYRVKQGDTLTKIARKYISRQIYKKNSGSLAKLLVLNPQLKNPNKLSIGQEIFLTEKSDFVAEPSPSRREIAKIEQPSLFNNSNVNTNSKINSIGLLEHIRNEDCKNFVEHKVKKGESFSQLVQKYYVHRIYGKNGHLKEVLRMNPDITSETEIPAGMSIKFCADNMNISAPAPATATTSQPVTATKPVVVLKEEVKKTKTDIKQEKFEEHNKEVAGAVIGTEPPTPQVVFDIPEGVLGLDEPPVQDRAVTVTVKKPRRVETEEIKKKEVIKTISNKELNSDDEAAAAAAAFSQNQAPALIRQPAQMDPQTQQLYQQPFLPAQNVLSLDELNRIEEINKKAEAPGK